jgi:hypothetical protein
MLTCPFKFLTGADCPGCGLQRSIAALFDGRFLDCITLYPATIPFLICLIFTALHLKFDFRHGAKIIVALYVFTAVTVVGFYIFKILTNKTF